jgi:hypothetical protein
MDSRIIHLKVKVKSLAAEARIIRAEERKAEPVLQGTLHFHRIGPLKATSRETQLAYGCLRGVPYAKMESSTFTEPDWDSIKAMAQRFCWVYNSASPRETWKKKEAAEVAIEEWLVAAKAALHVKERKPRARPKTVPQVA